MNWHDLNILSLIRDGCLHCRGVCRCSFSRVSPSALTTPGMDDFSLAKVECHGMTASTDFQVYLPMTVCGSLPVLLHKSGYSANSHGKFLALHALCQALSSQWQRKSLSRRDTGIKKAQHRGTGQKKQVLPQGKSIFLQFKFH